MFRTVIATLLLILMCASAANIRGRVDQPSDNSRKSVPSKGIIVDLVGKRHDLSKDSLIARFITSADGMYYFREVTGGAYKLALNGHIVLASLLVKDSTNQDLPPLVIK